MTPFPDITVLHIITSGVALIFLLWSSYFEDTPFLLYGLVGVDLDGIFDTSFLQGISLPFCDISNFSATELGN